MLRLADDYVTQARTASGANILLGVWLIASPWIFGYRGKSAVLGSVIAGALIACLAMGRLAWLRSRADLSGINLILAFWTLYSPWAYGYEANETALVNSVIVGLLVAALAVRSATATDAARKRRLETPAR